MQYTPAIFPSLRRHLRMTFASSLVVGLILLLTGRTNADPAPVAGYLPQLVEWKKEVDEKSAALTAVYGYYAAPKTQQAAFAKGGVVWAQRYSSSWGGWIYMDLDSAHNLHGRTLRTLKDSINQRNRGKTPPVGHFDKLTEMMEDFRDGDEKFHKLFNERVDLNVKQGLELDQEHHHRVKYFEALAVHLRPLADYHHGQAEKFSARALVFRTEGANVSAAIRKIGNP